ncbi:MAG: hypothetical protein ACYC43_05645 [Burkholderiales bacterium]
MRRWGLVLFLLGALAPLPSLGAVNWLIGNAPSYFSGDFYNNVRTGIFYDANIIQAQDQNWMVSLDIPYISITNLPNGAAYNGGAIVGNNIKTPTHNAAGLGDVTLASQYEVFHGRGLLPSVTPFFDVKFGTASTVNGLGTGLNDYTIGSSFQENLGWMTPFAQVGYDFVGQNQAFPLRNVWIYSAGTTVLVFGPGQTAQNNSITALFSGSGSEVAGTPSLGEVELAWNHRLTRSGTGFQMFVTKGLTNSSPNIGGGIGFYVAFQ